MGETNQKNIGCFVTATNLEPCDGGRSGFSGWVVGYYF